MTPALKKIIDDASALQKRAAHPDDNIWVMASAGTGKTTVLVERYIRLVLNNTAPDKILCLTYTKAAATQMKDRILKRLSQWVQMEDSALESDVTALMQKPCTPALLKKARGLMGVLLDHFDRLNIMTIHSFCQSLLSRFQIEAGLPGGLEVMEDSKSREIFTHILEDMLANDESVHVDTLLGVKGDNLAELLQMIVEDRVLFRALFNQDKDYESLLNQALQIETDQNEAAYKQKFMSDAMLPRALLKTISVNDKRTAAIDAITCVAPDNRGEFFDEYAQIFLTQKLELRKISPPKDEEIQAGIFDEQRRVLLGYERIRSMRTRDLTLALCYLAKQALDDYDAYKERHAVLDYQDLIEKTVALLSLSHAADWIRYKLDGGIDQILVDEAQDTNPLQWHIITKLVEEYFSGTGTRDPENRTLFVVGDTKQSIFGFHGADPETTARYHDFFVETAAKVGRNLKDIPLDTSFRTAKDILDVVDACSAWGETNKHIAGKDHPGRVELWPLLESEKSAKEDLFWTLPTQTSVKAQKTLIDMTADRIREMLDSNLSLPSKKGEAIEPQDILILVQKRTHYPVPLIQALRQRNVPVAGIDSFELTDDMAVKDVLAVLRWSMFPNDDLTLAEILKSPFVGWDDTQLGACAIHRKGSLWDEIKTRHADIAVWLREIRRNARRNIVDYTIQLMLEMPCPNGQTSGYRAIQKRLGPAAMDALEQLLVYARTRDIEEQSTLNFIHHLEKSTPRIKREMEGETARGVRIMTVHGAKGLEAPVVFLIDTIMSSDLDSKTSDLQWIANHEDVMVPLWATHKDDRASLIDELQKDEAQKLREEYYRLLYVAMTRAKDCLIISGATSTKAPKSESWYFRVQEALGQLETREENGIVTYGQMPMVSAQRSHITNSHVVSHTEGEGPVWPQEQALPEPESETAVQNSRAQYIGRQWHKLLERAIDRDDTEWNEHFDRWLEDLPDIDRENGLARLTRLRAHPEYGFLFVPGGAAEVPFITAGETLTRGRIDRLVMTDTHVWIIDYKTRLHPSQTERLAAYKKQMDGYRAALEPIVRGLPVTTLLVDIAASEIHVI